MTNEFVGDDLIGPALKITTVGGAQVLVFVFLYESALELYVSNVGPIRADLGFGITLHYAVYVLSILAGIQAVTLILTEKLEHKLLSTVLCTGIWIAYWGPAADYTLRRIALVSILGLVSFLTGLLLTANVRGHHYR